MWWFLCGEENEARLERVHKEETKLLKSIYINLLMHAFREFSVPKDTTSGSQELGLCPAEAWEWQESAGLPSLGAHWSHLGKLKKYKRQAPTLWLFLLNCPGHGLLSSFQGSQYVTPWSREPPLRPISFRVLLVWVLSCLKCIFSICWIPESVRSKSHLCRWAATFCLCRKREDPFWWMKIALTT